MKKTGFDLMATSINELLIDVKNISFVDDKNDYLDSLFYSFADVKSDMEMIEDLKIGELSATSLLSRRLSVLELAILDLYKMYGLRIPILESEVIKKTA